MLRADLASARAAWVKETVEDSHERQEREKSDFLTYRNSAGEIADFHATRHTYVSELAASGASVKTVQELARYSTPTLTFGKYAHARKEDLTAALDALPGHHHGHQTGRQNVRDGAISDDETSLLRSVVDAAKAAESQGKSDILRGSAMRDEQRRWSELNRRWRICNPLP